MDISIFGLGYVGAVSAAYLANHNHHVMGVDVDPIKIELINQGKATIVEPQLEELTKKAINQGTLVASNSASKAILNTELSFICVGTPCHPDNSLDLTHVKKVSEEIGLALRQKKSHHTLAYRSTMFPGSMRELVIPTLEKYSQKKAGKDFSVCFNPEFMMEGTAIYDYAHPPKNVIGTDDEYAIKLLSDFYQVCTGMPTIAVDFETAECIKYCDNIWHALKVGFANEIGKMCKMIGIDSHQVMDVFCQDTKLNISTHYLKPGFAFGGSCLPKDLRAFLAEAKRRDIALPIINAVLPSNDLQIEQALQMITAQPHKEVGILGLSFKANTDDLRESPTLAIIEKLLKQGYTLTLYDENVSQAKEKGANKEYILNQIPHISKCLVGSLQEVLRKSKTIVIANKGNKFDSIFEQLNPTHIVIDLVRIKKNPPYSPQYHGICW